MSSPRGSPTLGPPLQLKIPNGLPISPSPRVRALHENEACTHCENCKGRTNTISTPEPSPPLSSPPLSSEKSRLSLTQQLGQKLRFSFLMNRFGSKKEPKSVKSSSKVEYEQISPTRDWTADE